MVNSSKTTSSLQRLIRAAHDLLEERNQVLAHLARIDAALMGIPIVTPAVRNRKPHPKRQPKIQPVPKAPGLTVVPQPVAAPAVTIVPQPESAESPKVNGDNGHPTETEAEWDMATLLPAVDTLLNENPGTVPSFKTLPPITNRMLDKVRSLFPSPEMISPEKLSAPIWDIGREAYQHEEIKAALTAKDIRTIGQLLAAIPDMGYLKRKAQIILLTRVAKFLKVGPFAEAPQAVEELLQPA